MHGFNLGFNQRNFNGSRPTSAAAVNMGAMRGKGSTSRMLNFCKTHSTNPSGCINQFINIAAPPPALSYSATGIYTISSNSQYNTIITFTGDGTFLINVPFLISYLVVGGGGGGGSGYHGSNGGGGGGGGGGGVIENSLSFVGSYTITIGTGGSGGSNLIQGNPGISGGSSSITSLLLNINASGGVGGIINGGASGTPGSSGGTGNGNPSGGVGILGGGGGSGGYTASGGNGSQNIPTLNYGTIFGAGGGGGGGGSVGGTAGNSNAGNGGNRPTTTNAGNGVANTGGGGGGGSEGSSGDSYVSGGNGGLGVVILLFNV